MEAGGWVLYDGDCSMCSSLAARMSGVLGRRGFRLEPLQSRRLDLPEEDLLKEMRVLADGQLYGGARAVVFLSGRIWWAFPIRLLAALPGGMALLDAGYRFAAERRGCRHGACAVPQTRGGWLPLLVLTGLALSTRGRLPAWVFMWTLCAAIFLGFKWWMFRRTGPASLAYLLWPGMDAKAFAETVPPARRDWAFASLKTLLGAALFWGAARRFHDPLAAGWCGMTGLVFMLHFGSFHLLALLWRVRPIMRNPLAADSLGDFWGSRWNLAFREIGYELVFRPYHRKLGASAATLLIFLASGLIHELAITVPARGGYGLPTLYFMIQGFGLLAEKKLGGGRAFALLVAAAPAYWLFPPPFVLNVMIPFMRAGGALP